MVKPAGHKDKRHHRRYPLTSTVTLQELSLQGLPENSGSPVRGKAENISMGGLCLLTAQPLKVAHPVRCEIPLGTKPVTIGAILRVCWTVPYSEKRGFRYKSGLQFVLGPGPVASKNARA